MQNDETEVVETTETDESEVETQEDKTEATEEIASEEEKSEEKSEDSKPKEEGTVKLSPAEFRHYKKWKDSQKEPKQPQTAPKEPGVEETVLLAQGMPEELLTQLKKVAKINNTTLLKAQTDPIFVAVKDTFEKEQKRKQASLGGGRGAGVKKPEKTLNTPGLTRDEHREMFYKKVRG